MKKVTYKIEISLKSPLIVSSGETDSIVRSMIIGIDGRPIIPATTLKGIVRSNYIYLHHCQHKIYKCNCEACMLFGSQNNRSSLVFFEDLKPSEEYYVGIRTQTAIDRYRRAVHLNSLFSQKTIENTTFCGEISIYLPPELEKQNVKEKFEQAVKFIEMIGSGKSRGLGHVKVCIEEVGNRWKVYLNFKSPVLVGGRKSATNFIEGINYIPGSVVRAALAKFIVLNCKAQNDVYSESSEKRFWVEFKNKEACQRCEFINICKNFKEIKISFFYPKGTKPNPLCDMICKNNEDHGFYSELLCGSEDKETKCSKCPEGNNRVEKYAGLVSNGKPYSGIERMYMGKTAINHFTKTALKGSLFTLAPIVKTCAEGVVFEGVIEGISEEDLEKIKELRIGKYTSSGFGIACLSFGDRKENEEDKLREKAKQFSEKYKEIIKNDNSNFIALYFVSDILFKVDNLPAGYIPTEEYLEIFKNAIGIPEGFDIHKIFSQINLFRGVDTSKSDFTPKQIMYSAQAGTVLVLKTQKTIDEAVKELVKFKGFGEKVEDGYGWFEFYEFKNN